MWLLYSGIIVIIHLAYNKSATGCGRTRIFFAGGGGGGHRGGKMHIWGGKNQKNCQKWLIFAIFPFWRGGGQVGGGRASNWGKMPPHAPLGAPPLATGGVWISNGVAKKGRRQKSASHGVRCKETCLVSCSRLSPVSAHFPLHEERWGTIINLFVLIPVLQILKFLSGCLSLGGGTQFCFCFSFLVGMCCTGFQK